MSLSISSKRWLIACGYHAAIIASSLILTKLGTALENETIGMFAIGLLISDVLTFRLIPISRWIQESLIQEGTCYGCGAVVEFIGRYKCSCGYLSPKDRHIFSPCGLCKKSFRFAVCPKCETSITF